MQDAESVYNRIAAEFTGNLADEEAGTRILEEARRRSLDLDETADKWLDWLPEHVRAKYTNYFFKVRYPRRGLSEEERCRDNGPHKRYRVHKHFLREIEDTEPNWWRRSLDKCESQGRGTDAWYHS